MNIAALLQKAAVSYGDRPALTHGTTVTASYAALHARAGAIGAALGARGLMPGDRVGIAMGNQPAFLEALFGIWYAGLCAVPMNAKLHPKEFTYILENSGAKLCFTDEALGGVIEGVRAALPALAPPVVAGGADFRTMLEATPRGHLDRDPRDPAWLFYTSGTTGRPKGAMLSHRNLMVMTLSAFADLDRMVPGDTVLHPAPLSHASGLYALPHIAKACNNVIPESGGFEPDEIFSLLPHCPGTILFAAPTMMVRLLNSPGLGDADLRNLKILYYGGGPAYLADVKRAMAAFGPHLVQIYGQGESPMTITYLPREFYMDPHQPHFEERLASAGITRTDVEVRVADEDDNTLPAGELGEVLVRGDVVMEGYWQNPDATETTLRGGWLHTGDVGRFDEAGYLTLLDRSKDMIISGGTNIYPREIEEVLLRHEAVNEVAVTGKPHPEWGEEVVAFVVPHEGRAVEPEALDKLCLDAIARFKRPRDYRIVTGLPKNNYGKILKRELRDQLVDEAAGAPPATQGVKV